MKTISRTTRIRMLLRSFSIQGSWNYETLIGTGFAFTILPALRYLYQNEESELGAAVIRHAELFNSHPYFATVAVGAVTRLEADAADPVVIQRFKSALRGSLGSLGDRLVWSAWRPMSVLLGITLLLVGAPWWTAIATFLVVYNVLHLAVRLGGLDLGLRAGLEVGRRLRELPVQKLIEGASRLACALIGAAVVLVGVPAFTHPLGSALIVGAVPLGFTLGLRTRRVMIAALTGIVLLGFALGLIAHGA